MPKWLSIVLGILCASFFVSLPLLCADWRNFRKIKIKKRKKKKKDDR